MDFFERAHVPKRESLKKDSKSEEKVKKQLKQMLYGFKKSDNELIKNIANDSFEYTDPSQCMDDSVSVSGFSDLNLTDSSNEAEITQGTVESLARSTVALKDFELSEDKGKEGSLVSFDSISEYDDDIHSLSEDLTEITEDSESSFSDNISLITSLQGTSTTNESDTEEFDPDGMLAKEIKKKLNAKEKENSMIEKGKKRKIEKQVKAMLEEKSEQKVQKKKNKKLKNAKQDFVEDNIVTVNIEESRTDQLADDIGIIDTSSNASSAFISISASEMPSQSLSDLLGDYRHSTMRNLPSDKQNVIYTTNYSETLETEDSSLGKVLITDDVDSLTPEIDKDLSLEDLVSDTEVNSSTEPLGESTTNNDDTLQSDDTSAKELESEPYSNPIKVYYGKNCCVFVLKHPAALYIHGKVKVCALGGTVEVLGYTLKEEPCELYAPNCNYAHCLKTIGKPNTYYGLFSKLSARGLNGLESESIVTAIGQYDGVVCISPLKSNTMNYVEANFAAADLFSKPSKYIDHSLKAVSQYLGCSLYRSKPNKCFKELPAWEKALEYGLMNEQSRGIVCGGKGTGKSTFLRYYVNKLLAKGPVVVIDLDPGQPEFTPAGNVSATVVTEPILGPNFTHLKKPEIMLQIAMINTMDNPRLYMDSIYDILIHLTMDDRYNNMPWIVNTMGMCNDMGLRMINAIILHVNPTFVLQIHSKNIKMRFKHKLHRDVLRKLYEEEYSGDYIFNDVCWPDNLDYELIISDHEVTDVKNPLRPRDERYLNFLAYFGELAAKHNGDILRVVPYEVNLRELIIGTNAKVPRGTIAKVINGKIVALCEVESQDKGFTFDLDKSSPLPCHGYGLVRGVDMESGIVFIITAVAVDKLRLVNAAVYSDWAPELRTSGNLPAGTPLPYRTATHYDQRQLMFPPRRRFNPIQLLKMSRNS